MKEKDLKKAYLVLSIFALLIEFVRTACKAVDELTESIKGWRLAIAISSLVAVLDIFSGKEKKKLEA